MVSLPTILQFVTAIRPEETEGLAKALTHEPKESSFQSVTTAVSHFCALACRNSVCFWILTRQFAAIEEVHGDVEEAYKYFLHPLPSSLLTLKHCPIKL
jgi:hypothetical protein